MDIIIFICILSIAIDAARCRRRLQNIEERMDKLLQYLYVQNENLKSLVEFERMKVGIPYQPDDPNA